MKRENIMDAAIRRFSHFGINKTTLTEIADDLAISKPALFYYFPDKQSLVAAVEEKIINEYIDALEQGFNNCDTVEQALEKMVDVRIRFFEKYFMLANQLEFSEATSKALYGVKQKLKEKEVQLVAKLFETGVQSKELRPIDSVKTGGLLLETLSALAYCVREKPVIPDHQSFLEVVAKQKDVINIFYNGLKRW